MLSNLSSSSQDYLEAILDLSEGNDGVRVTDIANKLKIRKASVSQAVNNLLEEGLVVREKYGPVFLTEKGYKYAERVRIKHSLLKYFFEKILGTGSEIAENDACLIEHSLSPETFTLFANFLFEKGYLTDFCQKDKLREIISEDHKESFKELTFLKNEI